MQDALHYVWQRTDRLQYVKDTQRSNLPHIRSLGHSLRKASWATSTVGVRDTGPGIPPELRHHLLLGIAAVHDERLADLLRKLRETERPYLISSPAILHTLARLLPAGDQILFFADPAGDHDLFRNGERVHSQGYLTDLISKRAVQYVKDRAAAEQPFLLSLHYTAPHSPWEGPDDAHLDHDDHGVGPMTEGGSLDAYAAMMISMRLLSLRLPAASAGCAPVKATTCPKARSCTSATSTTPGPRRGRARTSSTSSPTT